MGLARLASCFTGMDRMISPAKPAARTVLSSLLLLGVFSVGSAAQDASTTNTIETGDVASETLLAQSEVAVPPDTDLTPASDVTPELATDGVSASQAASAPVQPILPILVFDRARILALSDMGKNFEATIDAKRAEQLSENKEIQDALEEEERELAALKKEMDEAEFAKLAEAFDLKVTEARDVQNAKGADIQAYYDAELAAFDTAMNAALTQVAREVRAIVILERQQVYLMSSSIDVSSEVIRRLDLVFAAQQSQNTPDEATDAGQDSSPDSGTSEQSPPAQSADQ